jgi:hypothetical protein
MTYLGRVEIKEQLEAQFDEIRKNLKEGNLNKDDVEILLFSEDDICDKVEPDSSNHQYAREMQHQFLTMKFDKEVDYET